MTILSKIKRIIPNQQKVLLRRMRTHCFRLLHGKGKISTKNKYYSIAKENHHVFFGYYDVSPFSSAEDKILCCITPDNKNKSCPMTVAFFECSSRSIHPIQHTSTWNWQQGCRLRWHPIDENFVIFNDQENGNFITKICDLKGKVQERLPFAAYDISTDFTSVATLDFDRLHIMRAGYGYNRNKLITEKSPSNDGLYIYDIRAKKLKLVISLDYLSKLNPSKSMSGAWHYINHIKYNPTSNRLVFFHLWNSKHQRFSRAITCDLNGENLHIFAFDNHVSHFTWMDSQTLIMYATYNGLMCYYKCKDQSSEIHKLGGDHLPSEDGHPSYFIAKQLLLTDTYPDVYSEQKLILYNQKLNNSYTIASIKSAHVNDRSQRCDLHPRFSKSHKQVAVDSTMNGNRCMIIFDIEPTLNSMLRDD